MNKLIYDAREEEGARERERLWEFLVDRASRPLIMGLEAAQEAWYLWATGIVSAGVGPVVPRNESAVFSFLYLKKIKISKIYFRFGKFQKYTPVALWGAT